METSSLSNVQIKVLTLDKKRMTHSIFKQIKHESLLDPDNLELKGIPLGAINYYWGNDLKDLKLGTIHVLWQKGAELRRFIISSPPSKKRYYKFFDR